MFDPVSAGIRAVAVGSWAAFIWVWLAGVVSSIGPCTAPRLIAVVSLAGDASASARACILGAFIGGLIAAYAAFGVFAGLLGTVIVLTHWIYVVLALALAIAGCAILYGGPARHECRAARAPQSTGAAFLLGTSFALVISPCCTPIVLAIVSYCVQTGNAPYSALLLCAFALGHAAPVALAGSAADRCSRIAARFAVMQPVRTVAGSLLLCLSGYYACIA